MSITAITVWSIFWKMFSSFVLTHSLPMDHSSTPWKHQLHPFSTPWKHRRTLRFSYVYRGQRKGTLRTNGLNVNINNFTVFTLLKLVPLSWRRPLSYGNQSTDLQSISTGFHMTGTSVIKELKALVKKELKTLVLN